VFINCQTAANCCSIDPKLTGTACALRQAVLFNTTAFIVFFTCVLLIYRRVGHRAQNWLLLLGSYFFYGWWDWRFCGLLGASTVLDWALALAIERAREKGTGAAKRAIALSIVANLAILGFFKYFNFFVGSAEHLLRSVGYDGSLWTLRIVLPVGISFYTFQSMSYTIDVYRGELRASKSLSDFALYVSFFPQLVAGPIERATRLLPQVQQPRVVTRADWEEGLLLFGLGLFRKVAIADPAGSIADTYFAAPGEHTTPQLAAGVLLYALQIYNDFGGYSDMARGCARLLGFTLMRNFRHPYFAASFSDFWKRWHISLSSWLRDYLYIPLGGNRYGALRTRANLVATMLLGGLWHGANWTFVVWGALHGAYLIAQHTWTGVAPRLGRVCLSYPPFAHRAFMHVSGATWLRTLRHATAAALVFGLVNFAWLFFRAPDFATASAYIEGLLAMTPGAEGALVPVAVLIAFTLFIDAPQAFADDEYVFLRWPVGARAVAAATGSLVLVASGSTHAPFVYFQF
jgi:D-alanyl-lipoteichoic acid acyltransferase DltB (MBOAT superfamily)